MSTKIGIDIEHCDNLPAIADPWTEPFYVENFSKAEIAYCQRQPNPRESFCGLWCAKEAVLKCGPGFARLHPRDVEIQHDSAGRPRVALMRDGQPQAQGECEISISHAHGLAVAVCAAGFNPPVPAVNAPLQSVNPEKSKPNFLAWLALALALLNLLLWILIVTKK
jgi:phosphopantetheine--protein transferase-like protein